MIPCITYFFKENGVSNISDCSQNKSLNTSTTSFLPSRGSLIMSSDYFLIFFFYSKHLLCSLYNEYSEPTEAPSIQNYYLGQQLIMMQKSHVHSVHFAFHRGIHFSFWHCNAHGDICIDRRLKLPFISFFTVQWCLQVPVIVTLKNVLWPDFLSANISAY